MDSETDNGQKYSSPTTTQYDSGMRLLYIDNIRWLMIVLVVVMHLNVTYSGIGSWYYKEGGALDPFSFTVFAMYGSLVQAFFMGFLFFIAGYFAARSYDNKGFSQFLKDRLFRLGIPTLVFMLLLTPIIYLIKMGFAHSLPSHVGSLYLSYITSLEFLSGSGPLWFALALLIFSCAYALLKRPGSRSVKNAPGYDKTSIITHQRVVNVIALISVLTFLTRLVQPIGTSILNMQLCYFSQYIVLFTLGIKSYKTDFLTRLTREFGITWFKLALYAGIPLWVVIMLCGGVLKNAAPFMGKMTWQAAAYALWESFFCVGVCLGLLVIFRDRFNTQGGLAGFLSRNAFAVYVFHPPLLVLITLLMRPMVLYPLLKMILAAIMVLPVCFGFSYLARKIPFAAKVFS